MVVFGRRCEAWGTFEDSHACCQSHAVPDQWILPNLRRRDRRRDLQRANARRHGGGAGHLHQLALRTPHVAFLGKSSHRLHPPGEDLGTEQAGSHLESVFSQTPGAREIDSPNRRRHHAGHQCQRSRSHRRSLVSLYTLYSLIPFVLTNCNL